MTMLRFPTKLQIGRRLLYEQSEPTPELHNYLREHGLKHEEILAYAGVIAVCLCQIEQGSGRFEFDRDGVPAVVIEAYAENAQTVLDLVAWPTYAPERFATYMGDDAGADMLGIPSMRNPATYANGGALRVHRTPHNWLKAGCRGCVSLNPLWTNHWLSRVPGRLLAEDLEHAQELRRLLRASAVSQRIYVPRAAIWRHVA